MQVARTKQPLRIWLLDLSLLAIFYMVFYHILLGHYPLLSPDEARYSEVSREMLLYHNFITPFVNHIPFLDKPPLFYWLQALCIYLFGLSEASLRLWPTIAGTLGVIATYTTANICFNRRTGLLAAVILGTGLFYFAMSHYANLDLTVALFISCCLYCYFLATRNEKINIPLLYLAYFFSALAILSKGIMGLALPMLVIFVYLIWNKNLKQLLKLHIPTGLLLIFCLVSPWFYLVGKANPGFWHYYVIVQQWQRYISTDFNDHQPFYFYAIVVIAGFTPWLFHLISGYIHGFIKAKNGCTDHRFFLCFFLAIFIFFSIPSSKLVGYILSCFFPSSILCATVIDSHWKAAKSSKYMFIANVAILILTLIGALALFIMTFHTSSTTLSPFNTVIWIFFAIVAFAALWLLLAHLQNGMRHFIIALTLFAICFNIAIMYTVSHYFEALHIRTTLPLTNTLKRNYKPGQHVFSFGNFFVDTPIYFQKPITLVYNIDNPNIQKHDFWAREFSVGMTQKRYQKQVINNRQFATIWNSAQRSYSYIDPPVIPILRNTLKLHVYILDTYQNISLISNKPTP